MTQNLNEDEIEKDVLDKFENIMIDFTNDIVRTFPEYDNNIKKLNISENKEKLYKYCKKQFCPNFFNILYKNEQLFDIDEENNKGLYLLPTIDFKEIYNSNISENTKNILWNYLQVLLFTCVKDVNNEEVFGETSKLFEAIDSEQLQEKLMKTMDSLNDAFKTMGMNNTGESNNEENEVVDEDNENHEDGEENETKNKKFNMDDFKDFLNPEDLNSHLSGIMDGKIGQLAKEIAGEAMESLDIGDIEKTENPEVFMKKMFKDPTKLMGLVRQIGGKLDKKMKDGSINQEELVKEAGEIMEKIQDIPGLKNVMSQMGMNTNGKMDFKGMMNKMQSTMKSAKMKDRMREKLKKRQEEQANLNNNPNIRKVGENNYSFRPEMSGTEEGFSPFMDDEPVLKSTKRDKPQEKKKGKKKGKKGKSKK
tara:strand:+ start:1305 stop:2567 length:1263 start_codon:yes stop_codon:yes gene_type:complete